MRMQLQTESALNRSQKWFSDLKLSVPAALQTNCLQHCNCCLPSLRNKALPSRFCLCLRNEHKLVRSYPDENKSKAEGKGSGACAFFSADIWKEVFADALADAAAKFVSLWRVAVLAGCGRKVNLCSMDSCHAFSLGGSLSGDGRQSCLFMWDKWRLSLKISRGERGTFQASFWFCRFKVRSDSSFQSLFGHKVFCRLGSSDDEKGGTVQVHLTL